MRLADVWMGRVASVGICCGDIGSYPHGRRRGPRRRRRGPRRQRRGPRRRRRGPRRQRRVRGGGVLINPHERRRWTPQWRRLGSALAALLWVLVASVNIYPHWRRQVPQRRRKWLLAAATCQVFRGSSCGLPEPSGPRWYSTRFLACISLNVGGRGLSGYSPTQLHSH